MKQHMYAQAADALMDARVGFGDGCLLAPDLWDLATAEAWTTAEARLVVDALTAAGWTVQPPQQRHQVRWSMDNTVWQVEDQLAEEVRGSFGLLADADAFAAVLNAGGAA